jgi:spermidine synthase
MTGTGTNPSVTTKPGSGRTLASGDAATRRRETELLRFLLPPSVFVSGAVVLVLEILGTRLIGPVYGTSLYVWSTLIAVTLVSLALGYWLGGRLADLAPRASVFFLLFDAAALLIALVPMMREPVFDLTRPWGLRGGALGSAVLFLAAPLTILGMISPFAVRLAAEMLATVGRTTGKLYAISTAGSLAGTLLAGFYLIPEFRVRTIFFGSAAALIVPAALYQLLSRRRQLVASMMVAAVLVLATTRPITKAESVLLVRDSFFGQIKVIQDGGLRVLLLNGASQTVVVPGTGESLIDYPWVMAEAAWRAAPEGKRAVIVGLGGGVLPPILATWGVQSQVVEIEPAMVETAQRYFAFDPSRTPVAIADGRQFLAASAERYDYVFLDAFAGEMVPSHLLTREMMSLVDEHLNPGGLVLLNYVGYRTGDRARSLRSVVATMGERFPWLRVIACGTGGDYGGNVVVAGRTPAALRTGDPPFQMPAPTAAQVAMAREHHPTGPHTILTDDYNPLDLWAVAEHEEWRREALAWLPWDVALAE